jgi:hypothetical protein
MRDMNLQSTVSSLRPPRQRSRQRAAMNLEQTRKFVDKLFGKDMHAARVASLANAATGVLIAAVVSIHAIGQAYAAAAKITAKSGVKQVDRLLSNGGLVVDSVLASWIAFVVGAREQIVLAMDWTEFDDDDHSTLCVCT